MSAYQETPEEAEARRAVSREENAYARACVTAGSTLPSTDAIDAALDAYRDAVRKPLLYRTMNILKTLAAMECNCDEAYTKRGRHEPNVFHSDFEDLIEDARALLAEDPDAEMV